MLKRGLIIDNFSVLNVRIVILFCAFVHLLVTALVTLTIDTTVDEDPKIQAYYYIKWKLLTCWFNLITLVYLPARLYIDWQTKKGKGHSSGLAQLNRATDAVVTSLLFPITVFSDVAFWVIYLMDSSILAPPRLFLYVPYWAQHSLHTVSLIFILLDLVLTPRKRPKSLKPRAAMLLAFGLVYFTVIYNSCMKGEAVYAICENISTFKFALMYISSQAIVFILFVIQWIAIDFLWGKNPRKISVDFQK